MRMVRCLDVASRVGEYTAAGAELVDCQPAERWREAARRSVITLRALTYRSTGGIVAAAAILLAGHIGGERKRAPA